jgi:hypothetical protein
MVLGLTLLVLNWSLSVVASIEAWAESFASAVGPEQTFDSPRSAELFISNLLIEALKTQPTVLDEVQLLAAQHPSLLTNIIYVSVLFWPGRSSFLILFFRTSTRKAFLTPSCCVEHPLLVIRRRSAFTLTSPGV